MTLRKYLLNEYFEESTKKEKVDKDIESTENEEEILTSKDFFESDLEAMVAEGWDADVFCARIFKKPLNEVSIEDIRVALKAITANIKPISYEELKEINNIVNGNKYSLDDGCYKKLSLQYDPITYEPINEED